MKDELRTALILLSLVLLTVWTMAMTISFFVGLLEQGNEIRSYYRRIEIVVPGYLLGEWLTQKVLR